MKKMLTILALTAAIFMACGGGGGNPASESNPNITCDFIASDLTNGLSENPTDMWECQVGNIEFNLVLYEDGTGFSSRLGTLHWKQAELCNKFEIKGETSGTYMVSELKLDESKQKITFVQTYGNVSQQGACTRAQYAKNYGSDIIFGGYKDAEEGFVTNPEQYDYCDETIRPIPNPVYVVLTNASAEESQLLYDDASELWIMNGEYGDKVLVPEFEEITAEDWDILHEEFWQENSDLLGVKFAATSGDWQCTVYIDFSVINIICQNDSIEDEIEEEGDFGEVKADKCVFGYMFE